MAFHIYRHPEDRKPLASAYLKDEGNNTIEVSRSEDLICIEIEEGSGVSWYSGPKASIWLTLEESAAIRDIMTELISVG